MQISTRLSTQIAKSTMVAGAFLALSAMVPSLAMGQTAQRWSVQGSGLASAPFGGGLSGLGVGVGFEAQLRYNPSTFSIGAGIDRTSHSVDGAEGRTVVLLGGFVEPRYVIDIGSDKVAPYAAARLAFSETEIDFGTTRATATGITINGGGGILIVLNQRSNIDIGATLGFKDLGTADTGTTAFDLGSGTNLIFRIGIAVGLGG